jgi:transposase
VLDALSGRDPIIGFQDEASPQTTANTVRLWSPVKPRITKNTARIKANASGFYAVNGSSVIEFPDASKKEDMCLFLELVRRWNGDRPIVVITYNFAVHRSSAVSETAAELDIHLVFLPPYSPDLNPIEFVWKSLKRVVSKTRVIDREHMTSLLGEHFAAETSKTSYFAHWKDIFYVRLL